MRSCSMRLGHARRISSEIVYSYRRINARTGIISVPGHSVGKYLRVSLNNYPRSRAHVLDKRANIDKRSNEVAGRFNNNTAARRRKMF